MNCEKHYQPGNEAFCLHSFEHCCECVHPFVGSTFDKHPDAPVATPMCAYPHPDKCLDCERPVKTFPTWKTVTLGKYKSADEYSGALKAKGMEIGTYAAQIMRNIPYAQSEGTVDLIVATGKELGMTDCYTLSELRASVEKLGLSVCPAEVGPALRDQNDDQPVGEWMYVLMEPILDSDSSLYVFSVGRYSDGTSLSTECADPERQFNLGTRWVVCRPAASTQSLVFKSSSVTTNLSHSYVPPAPNSDRWLSAAEAHFRAKWMPSSEAIEFLDAWKFKKE